ncbi:MAG: aminotransferase class I/II-fold pyridoxal phosphate-dependent enzyme [Sphingomonadaceae bacterium]|nr:aminotransferase class I/II-fold pyridoxal phosphate-dependent enzyme [Sphingomonadaceae bacterium]
MAVSIFEVMSGLARQHGAINLGQGFPDFGWPDALLARAADAIVSGPNQYPPMRGLQPLREAVARWYARRQGLGLAPEGVLITNGASEALAAAILALVRPGDTVSYFAPAYDLYRPMILRAGGIPRAVRLCAPDWALSDASLAQAFADPAPRLVIVNSPHNPAAVVWGKATLARLAAACAAAGAYALSDEVWEEVTFTDARFPSLLAQPGMAERCVKVGSGGKMFALTGWKVGWAVGAPELIDEVAAVKQYLGFTTPPATQAALAWALDGEGKRWVADAAAGFRSGHDVLSEALAAEGFAVLPSEGTYFLSVDLAASGVCEPDRAFARRAVAEHGVAAIPVSPFYPDNPDETVLRLCFAKSADTLTEAARRLGAALRAGSR